MTTFLLIRHAANELTGKVLYGRMPGVRLSPQGRAQAERLVGQLSAVRLDAIYSSPLERALETAEPLARDRGLEIRTSQALTEIETGEWTGLAIPDLAASQPWQLFNSYRSGTRAPGGELMLEAQLRMVAELDRLRLSHPDQTLAVVSHGDPIRAAILHFAGIPTDFFLRLEISPASVSVLELNDHGARITRLNDTGKLGA